MLDPAAAADLAMTIINRVGLPLVILGVIAYYLVPAHLTFLETATEQQKKQTEIVDSMRVTAEKALNDQSTSNARVEALTEAIGSADLKKLETLDTIAGKIDDHGTQINRVESKVDEIRASVKK